MRMVKEKNEWVANLIKKKLAREKIMSTKACNAYGGRGALQGHVFTLFLEMLSKNIGPANITSTRKLEASSCV